MKAFMISFVLTASVFARPNAPLNSTEVEERNHSHHWDDGYCSDVDLCPETCDSCLNDHQARKLAATWLYFSVNIDRRIADRTLTHDFSLHSDSDNTAGITGAVLPPGAATYGSRLDFIKAQPTGQYLQAGFGFLPTPDPYIILDVFHDCTKIALHWLLPDPDAAGDNIVDIRGVDLIHTVKDGCHWKIHKVFSEYNNLLYVGSQGECTEFCDPLEPVA